MRNTELQLTEALGDNSKILTVLIEALTHSGSNALDEELLKQVKKICKSSQVHIPHAYNLILDQLKKKNSQIRFLAFQMCKELFSRSIHFKELVLKDLQLIFKLAANINSKGGLPPPKSFAEKLKTLAIRTLQSWVNDYGDEYKQLKIAYNYFKNCKQINFDTFDVRTSAETLRENEIENRLKVIAENKVKKVMEDFRSYQGEMEETITTLSNCLKLLLPTPVDFFVPECNTCAADKISPEISSINVENDKEIEGQTDLRTFGITTDYSLKLEINLKEKIKITKTDENASIIQNIKDCVQLINNRFFPLVKKCSQALNKYSSENNNELKTVLEYRENLQKILNKYKALNIEDDIDLKTNYDDNSDSDKDFEEVVKEGYENSVDFTEEDLLELPHIKSDKTENFDFELCEKSKGEKNFGAGINNDDSQKLALPSTSKVTENKLSDRKKKLLKIAPRLPFDIDLYHWEDEKLTPPTLISTKMDVDKFWGCASSEEINVIPNPDGVAALRTRVIEFTGMFEPVKWACRAPLPNGKLCPRKDRFKCPFHGKIVPRNEFGVCQNSEDDKYEKKSLNRGTLIPEWQDPQLLSDIKASTGIDLKMPEGKGKQKKSNNLTHRHMKTSSAALKIAKNKNYPGLIDVVKKQNNVYTRLSKKIFNRSTLRRVSAVLNKIDKKKHMDKFGDCFNYP